MAGIADIWQHCELSIQALENTHVVNKITRFETALSKIFYRSAHSAV
jgi:hypothetical protein